MRRRLSSADRRSQLIEVGRQTFAELGYERTSVEEIARRAGITKPIVYEHFGGKEGLYAAVVTIECERLITMISEEIGVGTARQRMEAGILAFLRYVRDEPEGFRVLARDAPASREYAYTLSQLSREVGAIFARQFIRAGYDPSSAPVYARGLVGMITFVGQWWDEDRELPVEEIASHLAAMAWMGLRHLPPEPYVAPAEDSLDRFAASG
jgi:AcrR family transcriptional regulator